MAGDPEEYSASTAGLRARRERFNRRKQSKLAANTMLFGVVQHFLAQRWAPSQIARTLMLMWPDEAQRTVSQGRIYSCIYAMPKGGLSKDLIACLRRAKAKRMTRRRGVDRRGQMPDLLSTSVRSPQASDGAFPGHWMADRIKGASNRSAVGIVVERGSRLVMLFKLADATATLALDGFTGKLRSIEGPMCHALTNDKGK